MIDHNNQETYVGNESNGICKISKETKVIGAGLYNNLTIECYVGYGKDGERVLEINEGQNIAVYFK